MTAAVFSLRHTPTVKVRREFDPRQINLIANHPDVRPLVAPGSNPLDLGRHVANLTNLCLMGEHGGCIVQKLQPGLYEVHTYVMPDGRGPWALGLLDAVAHYGFTQTDCMECLTRVDVENRAAKMVAVKHGFRVEFARQYEQPLVGHPMQPAEILSLHVGDWAAKAPGLQDIGHAFHEWMQAETIRLNTKTVPFHQDDPNHNRYVGAAISMAQAGQIGKAINFYNRWAHMSRHAPVKLVSVVPSIMEFDVGCLRLVEGGFLMFRDAKEALQWVA